MGYEKRNCCQETGKLVKTWSTSNIWLTIIMSAGAGLPKLTLFLFKQQKTSFSC